MEIGNFYMHKKAKDVCMEILDMEYPDNEKYVVTARWWNLGYTGCPFLINTAIDTFVIYINPEFEWVNITNKLFIKRTKPGLPE